MPKQYTSEVTKEPKKLPCTIYLADISYCLLPGSSENQVFLREALPATDRSSALLFLLAFSLFDCLQTNHLYPSCQQAPQNLGIRSQLGHQRHVQFHPSMVEWYLSTAFHHDLILTYSSRSRNSSRLPNIKVPQD